MSSEHVAIKVRGLGKRFDIFDRPSDRLKQPLVNRMRGLLGLPPVQYGKEHWALRDVSFEIPRGETVGIIGRNGSGKSTLLQMICGILTPGAGDVEVNGRVAALLELGAGFNPEFTGRENVYMNGAILGLSNSEVDQRFEKIAAFADIGTYIDQPVNTYSSGMYVRLAFAVMAHVDAEILVIDEALAVGDVFFTQKCMRFLRQFQLNGTVLFVSHDSGAVVNLCQRAVWLDRGVLREIGPAHRICEHYLASQYASAAEKELTQKPAEAAPDKIFVVPASDAPERIPAAQQRDMRNDFINLTSLRNDIEIFQFSGPSRHFGAGGAIVKEAYLADYSANYLTWAIGGEEVQMVVKVNVQIPVDKMIIGFFLKDRLGQVLFGDNTHLSYCQKPVSAAPGDVIEARFPFRMPILPQGSYTVDVAVADGTHEEHVQLQWVHDAIAIKSHASSTSTGLIGIPFGQIELKKINT